MNDPKLGHLSIQIRNLLLLLTMSTMLALSGCSSSNTDEDDFGDVEEEEMASAEDAETDEVPLESEESDPVASSELADTASEVPPPSNELSALPPPSGTELADSGTSESALPPPDPISNEPLPPPTDLSSSNSESNSSSNSPYNGATESYTVQTGDTLMKIAFQSTGDLYRWNEIYELNKDVLSSPNNIPKGTTLKIPSGQNVSIDRNGDQYLIKRGDTLGTIAKDVYGDPRKWRKIWKNNSQLIKDPNKIYAGFNIYYVPESGSNFNQELAQPTPEVGAPEPQDVSSQEAAAPALQEASPLSQEAPASNGRAPASAGATATP